MEKKFYNLLKSTQRTSVDYVLEQLEEIGFFGSVQNIV